MKHLLTSVAVAAALAIAAPAWAQNPSGGNAVGAPGPNPGGPGLTPYSGSPPPMPAAPEPMPPPAAAPPMSNSAMPPMHRPVHPVHHARAMHAFHKGMAHRAAMAGDTTADLNHQELARIHSGDVNSPPPPSEEAPPPGGGGMAGPKTSGASGAGPR